uniref:Cell cycle control protein n=1 Tax=Nannospalax galili TaxID=1026970 RepID=A0A8C6R7A6_NANGA
MKLMSQVSRLPENTALKRQTLPCHWLQLSAPVVLSIFFATGIFCLCVGIILLLSAKTVKEIKVCTVFLRLGTINRNDRFENIKMEGNIYIYYKLHGFYQKIYQYVLPSSHSQLVGEDIWNTDNCVPFHESPNGTPIIPCGAIANSMLNGRRLTWWTDKYIKFQNPKTNDLASKFAGKVWVALQMYQLGLDIPQALILLNTLRELLIVWMQSAAFSAFKKLYQGLPAGHYSFNISYITVFQGEKSVVLCTLTWSGGGSLFLGLTYTVTGALTWLASFVITAIYLMLKNVVSHF